VNRLGSVIDSVEALNSALVSIDTPNGTETSAYTGHGFGFKTKYTGMLSSISVKCREDGNPAPNTGAPSWVKVWSVGNGITKLLALSKNYQVHHVGDTLHYVFDPFYVYAGQELRVIFYGESELDSTEYAVGNSSCCMKAIKLVATEATPIFGGVINNTGRYAYSGATVWQADYEAHIVKAEANPEQPVTMLLRAIDDFLDNNGNYIFYYSIEIPYVPMQDLVSESLPADDVHDVPIISPLFTHASSGAPAIGFGGYMVTVPRRDADLIAAKWVTLMANTSLSGMLPRADVTYLS
jgi:hypothetical protein